MVRELPQGTRRGLEGNPASGRRVGPVAAVAAENAQLLHRVLRMSKVTSARIGYVSAGLNAAAQPCMLDNSIVKDDLGIGLGPHPQLERSAADPTVSFDCTIRPVRMEIGR